MCAYSSQRAKNHQQCHQINYARIALCFQVMVNGNLELLAEIPEGDEASSWTLLQQTYVNINDNTNLQFVVRGDLEALSPDSGHPVLAIDDYSLTSSACPLVSILEMIISFNAAIANHR